MTQFSILSEDGESVITVVVPGDNNSPYIARDDHPNFKAIVGAALEGYFEGISALFDVGETIALKFRRLSERVTVEDDSVFFDGVAVDSVLTQQIVAVLNAGASDASWEALVNFFEKVQQNPSENSREQLYVWIKAHNGLTIAQDGDIVGYKGVEPDGQGSWRSINSGSEKVLVNDETFTGKIPNPVGATVEMARDLVDPSSTAYCSVGLHVGTYGYASSWGRNGATLEVRVNPRDVVAVPSDSGGQKVRTCRYKVVGPVEAKYDSPVLEEEIVDAVSELDALVDELAEAIGFEEDPGVTLPAFLVGDRVVDGDCDYGTVELDAGGELVVRYDDIPGSYLLANIEEDIGLALSDEAEEDLDLSVSAPSNRIHGRGGAATRRRTAEDPYADVRGPGGRFTRGRPGSTRDPQTGRFA